MKKRKRIYYKSKLISITDKMNTDLKSFCKDRGIKSEAELVRQAIAKYIYPNYKDATLNHHIKNQIQELFTNCQVSIAFK